jgi:hypothetical protein
MKQSGSPWKHPVPRLRVWRRPENMNLFAQPIVSETPAGRYSIRRILLALIIAATGVTEVRADRGAIPFKRHVLVFEPNQRALLAWNGTEQITILTTGSPPRWTN